MQYQEVKDKKKPQKTQLLKHHVTSKVPKISYFTYKNRKNGGYLKKKITEVVFFSR